MAASLGWSTRCALGVAALLAAFATHADSASSRPVQAAVVKMLTVTIANADDVVEAPPRGGVTSDPPGIDCPDDCSEPFEPGTRVELTATATPGYALARWSASPNGECEQPPDCTVTIDEAVDTSVEATFHPAAGLHAVPRGAGTIEISPAQPGKSSLCDVDFQQDTGFSCVQRYVTGTRVTVTAHPVGSGRFIGWSDYACSRSSTSCTLTMAGERFIAARFSPVTLSIDPGAFGPVVVYPTRRRGGFCDPLLDSPPCTFTYPAGRRVSVRREHAAEGQFWVGACLGNTRGLLDADVCRLRLDGDELVDAGGSSVTSIPPPLGSGIRVKLGGNKRGRVKGRVINGNQRLNCGRRCSITGLTSYDRVSLVATSFRRSRFVRWSDGNRLSKRTVSVAKVNGINAKFASRRR
jgi:hypothetical protein